MKPFTLSEMTFKGHTRSTSVTSFFVTFCQRPEN